MNHNSRYDVSKRKHRDVPEELLLGLPPFGGVPHGEERSRERAERQLRLDMSVLRNKQSRRGQITPCIGVMYEKEKRVFLL